MFSSDWYTEISMLSLNDYYGGVNLLFHGFRSHIDGNTFPDFGAVEKG